MALEIVGDRIPDQPGGEHAPPFAYNDLFVSYDHSSDTTKYIRTLSILGARKYIVDQSETDQGATASGSGKTIYDIMQTVGTGTYAVIKIANDGNSSTLDTSIDCTSYPYLFFDIEPGAMFARVASETITFYSPENLIISLRQQITAAAMIEFAVPGTITPQMFGAFGDGVDHSASFQYAMDAAVGGKLYCPTGTYLLSTTADQPDGTLEIVGDGMSSTIFTGSADPLIQTDDDVDNYFGIHGARVYPTSTNTGLLFTKAQTADYTQTMGAIDNIEFCHTGTGGTDGPILLDIFGAQYVKVGSGCRFHQLNNAQIYAPWSGTGIRLRSDATHSNVQVTIDNPVMHYLKYGILHPDPDTTAISPPTSQAVMINNPYMHGIHYGIHMTKMEQATIKGGLLDNVVRPIFIDSSQNNRITVPWIMSLGAYCVEVQSTIDDASVHISDSNIWGLGSTETFVAGVYLNGNSTYAIDGAEIADTILWAGSDAAILTSYTKNSYLGRGCTFWGATNSIKETNPPTGTVYGNAFGPARDLTNSGISLAASSQIMQAEQYRPSYDLSTHLETTDFSLSSGWGSTASVTAVAGHDSAWEITVNSAGTGQGANPTITLTFKDGAWRHGTTTAAPVAISKYTSGYASSVHTEDATTTTTWIITFIGTPVSGEDYLFTGIAIGR